MNNSGDAAEQIVRMALGGAEVALKLTGAAAKEIALLLLAALKAPEKGDEGKTKLKGKERLSSMLKSGKPLEVFSIRERDLRTFAREAKNYGVVYCALRNGKRSRDGICDILVKADDAPKINRLVERFDLATVDRASVEREPMPPPPPPVPPPWLDSIEPTEDPREPCGDDISRFFDELLGPDRGGAAPEAAHDAGPGAPEFDKPDSTAPAAPAPANEEQSRDPLMPLFFGNDKGAPSPGVKGDAVPLANGGRSPFDYPPPNPNPSAPSSGSREKSGKTISIKPSVKKALQEIAAARKAKEAERPAQRETPPHSKSKGASATEHRQPQARRKPKTRKER